MRRAVPQRRRFFVGVEGDGEAGFVAWLQSIAEERGLFVHYRVRVLQGGDPLHMVEKAVRARSQEADRYPTSLLIIDGDVVRNHPDRAARAARLAAIENFTLLAQSPDQEAVLLRLHIGHERDAPQSPALHALQRVWHDYRKPVTRQILARRFAATDLDRARRHDAFLDQLLQTLGFA